MRRRKEFAHNSFAEMDRIHLETANGAMCIKSIMQNGSIVSYSGMLAKQGLNNDRSMSILASLIFRLSTVFDVVQPHKFDCVN